MATERPSTAPSVDAEGDRLLPDQASARQALVDAARSLLRRGLIEGTAGNLSVRLASTDGTADPTTVLLTPTSLDYDEMTPADLVHLELDGAAVSVGQHPATSESALHLTVLRRFPEIGAVVHSHAVHASIWAVAGRTIPCVLEEMALYVGGDVPVAEYQLTGTQELADAACVHLGERGAVLLANHGLLTVGRSLDEALFLTSLVDRAARIVAGAERLGASRPLPGSTVERFATAYREQRHRHR